MDKLPPIYAGEEHGEPQSLPDTEQHTQEVDVDEADLEPVSRPWSWQPVLAGLGVINAIGLGVVAFRLFTLSYYDIADVPMVYYAKPNDIVALSLNKPDPMKAQDELVKRLQQNHALILNADSILVASPEYEFPKLPPKNSQVKAPQ